MSGKVLRNFRKGASTLLHSMDNELAKDETWQGYFEVMKDARMVAKMAQMTSPAFAILTKHMKTVNSHIWHNTEWGRRTRDFANQVWNETKSATKEVAKEIMKPIDPAIQRLRERRLNTKKYKFERQKAKNQAKAKKNGNGKDTIQNLPKQVVWLRLLVKVLVK